jgi:putative transposase
MPPVLQLDCRKRNRIRGFDYSQNNYYFVTVNTDESRYYLGKVESGKMVLNEYGNIVENCIKQISDYSYGTLVDVFVVMPNHIHIIIAIERYSVGVDLLVDPMGQTGRFVPTKEKSISEIVKNFKTYSSKLIHQSGFSSFSWQRSFWDHVIRDDRDLFIKQEYIINNPPKWQLDKNNFESQVSLKKRGQW